MPARLLLAAALATACHATLAQESSRAPGRQRAAPRAAARALRRLGSEFPEPGQRACHRYAGAALYRPAERLHPEREFHADGGAGAGAGRADPGNRAPAAHRPGNRRSDRGAARIRVDGRRGADRARRHAGPRRAQYADRRQRSPSPAAQIQGQASAGATASSAPGTVTSTTPGVTNSVNVQTTPGTAGVTTERDGQRCRAPVPATARSRPARRAAARAVDQREPGGQHQREPGRPRRRRRRPASARAPPRRRARTRRRPPPAHN